MPDRQARQARSVLQNTRHPDTDSLGNVNLLTRTTMPLESRRGLTPDTVLQMQRLYGNRSTAHFIQRALELEEQTDGEVNLSPDDLLVQKLRWGTSYSEYASKYIKAAQFMGIPISGGVHEMMLPILKKAEDDFNAALEASNTTFDRRSIGGIAGRGHNQGGLHRFGLALDFDSAANPYLMHEQGEAEMDRQLEPVYHRIALLMLGRESAIPQKIKEGKKPADLASYLYDLLQQESAAMQRYFRFQDDDAALTEFLDTPEAQGRLERLRKAGLLNFIPTTAAEPVIEEANWDESAEANRPTEDENFVEMKLPQLEGMKYQIKLDRQALKTDPKIGKQDRPFAAASGSPENGFLHLQKEMVMALRGAGMRWGAVDLDAMSGDVMHFDLGDMIDPINGASYASVVINAKAQLKATK